MFAKIIAFSLRKKPLILLLTFGLVVGGSYAFSQLPIDAVPDITNNQVQVLTSAPAFSPYEVEHYVSAPLEVELKSLPNIVELRSLSRPGLSVITIVFKESVDLYFARQLVHEKISEIASALPNNVETPQLAPVSTGLGEVFRYVVKDTTGRLGPMDLRTVQDWIVRKQLQGLPGIAEVNSLGGFVKQYHVLVDPDALIKYSLTLKDIYDAVHHSSGSAGGGYIEQGEEQYTVRSAGQAMNIEDVRSAVVKATTTGTPILVRDVASVEEGAALRFGSASQDGKGEVVTGIAMMLKGSNSRITVQALKSKLETMKASLPHGVVLEPYYDRESLVDRTIHTVAKNLLEGAVLVVIVLLLLLANLRSGLILASMIPLAMLLTVILMLITGQSGNLMSLGAIDFGLVVDGSLIIVENLLRRLSQNRKLLTEKLSQPEMDTFVSAGAMEVLQSAKFGVFIIIIVYLPILTLQGVEGKFFRPMAITVGFALISALVLSVTYVPVMCAYVLNRKRAIKESWIIHYLTVRYEDLLHWAFEKRKIVLSAVAIIFVGSLFLFSGLGGEFMPRLDEGDISLSLIRLPSISLTESQKLCTEAERVLRQFPEVKTIVSHTGRAEISTDPMGVELSDVFIILKPKEEWTSGSTKQELIERMSKQLDDIPGIGYQFLQPIEMRMNELIAGVKGDVAIKVFGDDFAVLNRAGEQIARILNRTTGAEDVTLEQTTGLPQLTIHPDRPAIARYGITIDDLNGVITTALAGGVAGQLYEGEKRFDVVLKYSTPYRSSPEAIGRILVPAVGGASVPLSQLSRIELENAPAQISRENGSRFITVQANVRHRDIKSFVGDVQHQIESRLKLPAGYSLEYGGQFKNLQAASQRLLVVVPLALFLIFFLLYEAFASLRPALLIFLCVPLAVIGGIGGLTIAGLPFSISAGVGFIALFGIAVLNGIVMVAAIRKYEAQSMPMREAIHTGSRERLRPVITTAALAGFGFLPMLIAQGAGAEVQRPLATVIIGGLISSTFLTLIVLPLVYERFSNIQFTNMRSFLGKSSAFALLLCAFLMASCSKIEMKQVQETSAAEHSDTIVLNSAMQKTAGIALAIVTQGATSDNITAPARIVPSQSSVASVGSFIAGRVTKLLAREGQRVARNGVIAELTSYDLSELVSEYLKAKAEETRTERILARQSKLSTDKLLSQQELDDAETNHVQAIARTSAAVTKLRTLGLYPLKLGEYSDAAKTTLAVRSPIAGVISKQFVRLGDFVEPDSNLFEVMNLDEVSADAQVSPIIAKGIMIGSVGFVRMPDGSDKHGKVIFVSPQADPVTHTLTVRIALDNRDAILRPEMFLSARFPIQSSDTTNLTIPKSAIEQNDRDFYVYKVVSDSSFVRVAVQVIARTETHVFVRSDELSNGDRVVIAGTLYLKSVLKKEELQESD